MSGEENQTDFPPSIEGIRVLQQKLIQSEHDADHLLKNLSDLGFPSEKVNAGNGQIRCQPITPFKMQTVDPEVLQRNYEALVSRCCKTESAIQSVKLAMLRVQAEKDLTQKERASSQNKLIAVSDAFEKELKRLARENQSLKKENEDTEQRLQESQAVVKKMQKDLEEADTAKAESAGAVEEAQCSVQKSQRTITELRNEISREKELRSSLEESHNTLLTRIKDMETVVDKEREEVKALTSDCDSWKKETAKAHGEMQSQIDIRSQIEGNFLRITEEKEKLLAESRDLLEDKHLLMSEMGRMQSQYTQLNEKLDQAHLLIQERQRTREQLERENVQLMERFREAANQNAQIVADYESRIESERAELLSMVQEGESSAKLQQLLTQEAKDKAQAQHRCNQVEKQVTQLAHQLAEKDREISGKEAVHEKEVSSLKTKISLLETDKTKALKEKDMLLDEVNNAVDGMAEEKSRLEAKIEDSRIEIQSLTQANKQMEEEMQHLTDRLTSATSGHASLQQMEASLGQMNEEKQKLAYDKGKLESTVQQLRTQLQDLATASNDAVFLRRNNSALEGKCSKLQGELTQVKMEMQKRESQLKHAVSVGDQRDTDFKLAIQSRDEALAESRRLLKHLDSVEDAHKNKTQLLEQRLNEARSDNTTLASTLESVMHSHSQLQSNMENLQMELGRKDALLSQLTEEKAELDELSTKSKKQLESMSEKLSSMENIESQEIQPLRKALELCKEDNSKMASSLESLLKSNAKLQESADKSQNHLSQKKHMIESMNRAKDQDQKQHKLEVDTLKERIDNMKEQLRKERNSSNKRNSKEVNEVRHQLEESLSKNGELSRANTDLRHKISDFELQLKEQKDKVAKIRSQNDHLLKVRQKHEQTLGSMQDFKNRLTDLESTKDEYVRKNKEQAKTIEKFVGQIADLQVEISQLAKSQVDSTELLASQEEQCNRERQSLEELQTKYKRAKDREKELVELHSRTEQKLKEANDESMQISCSFQDAHEWFSSRFDSLQQDLARSSSRYQISDYKEIVEGRRIAAETAEKAKAMIKASRETIGRLANYAEISKNDTQLQLREMRLQLDSEKQRSEQLQKKLYNLQDSSLRHTEELAKELEILRSQASVSYDGSW